jgi:hypothetical protein
MFDIYCPHCGEPHDQDVLHEAHEYGAPEGLSYMQAAALFKKHGCGLFKGFTISIDADSSEGSDRIGVWTTCKK